MLVAKKILVHGGKRYKPGDPVHEESEKVTKHLIRIGAAEVTEEKENEPLAKKKVDELKEIAKDLEISNFEDLKKDELIKAIEEKQK